MNESNTGLRSLRAGILLATLLSTAPGLHAQEGSWSIDYDRSGVSGRVFAVTGFQDELYVGGQPLAADGEYLDLVARFDGDCWRTVGNLEGSVVRDLNEYQGELIAAGEIGVANGQGFNSIARWDGSAWQPLGAGLTQGVLSTRVFETEVYQGQLYAVGEFDQAGGQTALGIARWNGSSWSPVAGGLTGTYPTHGRALLAAPDGYLYVGGNFDFAGGVPASNVARWNGSSWSALGSGTSSDVFELEWYGGKLYAGGQFGVAGGVNVSKIAAWNGSSWEALGGGVDDWTISTEVYALEVFAGQLYVGGDFVTVDDGAVPANRIARWDGSQWSEFGGVDGSDLATTVIDLAVLDGKLYVGGEFEYAGLTTQYGDLTATTSITTWDDQEWGSIGRGLGFDGAVETIIEWNGGLVAGGTFQEAGDKVSTGLVYRPAGATDWEPLGIFTGAFGGYIQDAVVFEGDLVVTGSFDYINTQPIPHVARFDGQQWTGFGNGSGDSAVEVYQGELYAAGLGVRRWNGTNWVTPSNQSMGGFVYDMLTHDGLLYVCGSIGLDGQNVSIVQWDGTVFSPVGGGADDAVYTMTVHQNDLVVGGEFSQVGGVSADLIARWDGSSWSAFGSPLDGTSVWALAPLGTDLYASGNLFLSGTQAIKYVARWDGSSWNEMGGGMVGSAKVMLGDEVGNQLYIGGGFSKVDGFWFGEGIPSSNFAVWSPDGSSPAPYCTAKTTSAGCEAQIGSTGMPSVASADFTILADQVQNQKNGLMFYGYAPKSTPFFGGTLCVQGPLKRTPLQASGGSAAPANDCSGSFAYDFGARIASGVDPSLVCDADVYAQFWFRDPQDPTGFGTALSDALKFTIQP